MKRLIVNADDFGYTPGVTRGILRGHRDGIVTSTTVMINMPYAEEALKLARENTPTLGVGLHLNLTAGAPISDPRLIPDLVDVQGHFWERDVLIPKLNSIDPAQARQEIEAQVAQFVDWMGKPPDHLDSHHHSTYMTPALMDIMLNAAARYDIPIRQAVPYEQQITIHSLIESGLAEDEASAQSVIDTLRAQVSSSGVKTADHFLYGFWQERTTLGDLLNMLLDLPEGVSELMTHPGDVDEDLQSKSSYSDARSQELAILTQPSVRELVRSEGIKLITFGALR